MLTDFQIQISRLKLCWNTGIWQNYVTHQRAICFLQITRKTFVHAQLNQQMKSNVIHNCIFYGKLTTKIFMCATHKWPWKRAACCLLRCELNRVSVTMCLKWHTAKPGPDSDSDPDSDPYKTRTREKPGLDNLTFEKSRTCLQKTRTRNKKNWIQNWAH